MDKILAQNLNLPLLSVLAFVLFSIACGSPPTQPRSIMPADALIYLETRDLGQTMKAIIDSPKYHEMAKTVPDLSSLHGIEISVAVTGFETSEDQVTTENSILNFRPRFVAAAETHYWNFQVTSFVEEELGEFISGAYGGESVLESSEKHGGKYYVWTGKDDKHKAYALVLGSLILFGNDESAIEKCLSVKNGGADSMVTTGKVTDGDRLAFGYVAPDGVAQIANIAGISLAMNAADDSEAQSFIARVLPEMIRNSVKEITWTAAKAEAGIEDKFTISTDPESAAVLNQTLIRGKEDGDLMTAKFLSDRALSVSRYNLADPRIAWRSVLLTSKSKVDDLSGAILAMFSDGVFEPYGIADPEMFLGSVGSVISTAVFDEDGEKLLIVTTLSDAEQMKASLSKEFNFSKPPEKIGVANSWTSEYGDVQLIFAEEMLILGDPAEATAFYARMSGNDNSPIEPFKSSDAVAVTLSKGLGNAPEMIGVFSELKADGESEIQMSSVTETRFDRNGIERRNVSDFGFIGTIIAQFGK